MDGLNTTPIKLYIASSTDIEDEEHVVLEAIQEVNTGAIAHSASHQFESSLTQDRRQTHSTEANKVFSVRDCDIFLGLVWLSFSPPVKGSPTQPSEDIPSSNLAQFELVHDLHLQTASPRIILFRCIRPPDALTELDIPRLMEVEEFFKQIAALPGNGCQVFEYKTKAQLKRELSRKLSLILQNSPQQGPGPNPNHLIAKESDQYISNVNLGEILRPGKSYSVAFVSVDIAKHSEILKGSNASHADAELLLNRFKNYCATIAKDYGGGIFSWAGDGGLLIFWREDCMTAAILTGLRLQQDIMFFNLEKNPIKETISIRVAGKDGTLLYQPPPKEIASHDINFVEHLQKNGTEEGAFCVSETLLDHINEKFREKFRSRGRFEGQPIYSYRLTAPENGQKEADLEKVRHDATLHLKRFERLLEKTRTGKEPDAPDNVSTVIGSLYSSLDNFISDFTTIEERWSPAYLSEVEATAKELLSLEEDLWTKLKEQYLNANNPELGESIAPLIKYSSARRGQPVVSLEKIIKRIHDKVSGHELAEDQRPEEHRRSVLKKIINFAESDELDRETILIDLIMNHRTSLLEFITNEHDSVLSEKEEFIEKLWTVADLPLIDDLYSLHDYRREGDKRLFPTLASVQVLGRRFSVVNKLLSEEHDLSDPTAVEKVFETEKIAPNEEDLDVVWRCLLIGHRDKGVRESASDQLDPDHIWRIVAHTSIPVQALYAVGLRIAKSTEDFKKIFFDCVRGQVEREISTASDELELQSVKELLSILLQFDFLVESGYFERIEGLLYLYERRSETLGLEDDFFGDSRDQLEKERQRKGMPKGRLPEGIKNLPLTLQRRLAGEAEYMLSFVSHSDPRVARETYRHIDLGNVERVLRIKELNSALLRDILKRDEFFARQGVTAMALNHPKCDMDFARRYIPGLVRSKAGRKALTRLADNHFANSDVRQLAKAALARLNV